MLNHNLDDKLFHLLVADVKDKAIFLVDSNGCIASWNAGAESLNGYAAYEVLGKPLALLYHSATAQTLALTEHLNQALIKGQFENVDCIMKADGTLFKAQLTYVALYDDKNKFSGFAHTIKKLNSGADCLPAADNQANKVYAKQVETAVHSYEMEPFTYMVTRNLPAPVANIKGLTELLQGMHVNDREYDALLNALSACADDLDKVVGNVAQILNNRKE